MKLQQSYSNIVHSFLCSMFVNCLYFIKSSPTAVASQFAEYFAMPLKRYLEAPLYVSPTDTVVQLKPAFELTEYDKAQ
jgi:hypothetical protein